VIAIRDLYAVAPLSWSSLAECLVDETRAVQSTQEIEYYYVLTCDVNAALLSVSS
jgi:hypothetical protein